jgi:serine/threonine-protein kinase
MKLWAELRKRRVFPFLGAYIAGGFLVLEGVDQLIGNGILPDIAYKLALVFYLFGIPGTSILAWFHGEKGTQKPPAIEIWLQAILLVAALAVSAVVFRSSRAADAVTGVGGLDPRRVAVLYFEDLSAGQELAYLADGITESLIDQLTRVRALDVISRNGVAPFRGTDVSRDSIAQTLETGSLIYGTVEPDGDNIRVTYRLWDGNAGADFERGSVREPAGDLIAIKDKAAQDVARILRARLGEEIRVRERRAATSSTDAWALVQRAERTRKDGEGLLVEDRVEDALDAFQRADSLLATAEAADRQWVEPTVLRGQIAYRRARLARSEEDLESWIEIGLDHVERALEIAPNDAPALELRGTLRYASWIFLRPVDSDEADRLLESARLDLESATDLDGTLASAYSTLSHLYYQIDDVPKAVLAAREAYQEDAYLDLAPEILWRLYSGQLDLGIFDRARYWCDEGADRFPRDYRFSFCQLLLMATPGAPPDVDRGWELLEQVEELVPKHLRAYERADGRIFLAGVIARAGLPDSARAVLAEARSLIIPEVDPSLELTSWEAYVRILLGEQDEAVALLERYAAANPGHFESGASTSWWWRDLQGHPRFRELVGTGSRR